MPSLLLFGNKKKFAPSSKEKPPITSTSGRTNNARGENSKLEEAVNVDATTSKFVAVPDNDRPQPEGDKGPSPPYRLILAGADRNDSKSYDGKNIPGLDHVELPETSSGGSVDIISESDCKNTKVIGGAALVSQLANKGEVIATPTEQQHSSGASGEPSDQTSNSQSVSLRDIQKKKQEEEPKTTNKPKSKGKERNALNANLNQSLTDYGKDVDELRMRDFIYFNPEGAGMVVDGDGDGVVVCETNASEGTSTIDGNAESNKVKEEIGPRVMLSADGELVIDQASLTVANDCPVELDSDLTEAGTSKDRDSLERRSAARRSWSPENTRQFYVSLNRFGTDLSMVASELEVPRWVVKLKYKRECKCRLRLIEKAQCGVLTDADLNEEFSATKLVQKKKVTNNKNGT